ncbi:TRAP transporter small permease subunit [Candidatus Contubernalis alkaliaceticus]|uniref:TRAP transporter small permease subunit n=1 Tax=Candidatus Contubernalis alkaliaceticus TaxID=338645 RepID=UPI001F4C4217|nr:TRAP transporter small permease subunit [Candidatus Contubernalis alkalaceticus]UNC92933.1 TRAP transporter small permease subunit [Candidatus Contubernalis alkalaceticus]
MKKFTSIIDSITEWAGKIISFLIVPLMLMLAYDIIIRKIDTASIYVYDLSLWLFSLLFLTGISWVLLNGDHISIEVFSEKYPARMKIFLNLITLVIFLLPLCLIQISGGFEDFMFALTTKQQSVYSPWRVVVWPMKAMLPAGFALLLLQTISETVKNIYALIDSPKDASTDASADNSTVISEGSDPA